MLFAILVVLGAGAGLALVWREAWIRSLPRVTVSLSRQQDRGQPDTATPAPAQTAVPAPAQTEPAGPTPAPEPAPAVGSAPPSALAPEPTPEVSPAPPSKRAPDPATGRVARRPEPPPAVADHPPLGAASRRSASTPRLLSARTDPGIPLPMTGARVISLVPVGAATAARGQLLWEPLGGGTLVVSGLPQPPAGRTYQLWLGSIDLGSRISAGLVAVDAQGSGMLRVAPPRATWSPDIFGVTMERQGGAREPSDNLVLVGELPTLTAAAPPSASTMPPAPPPSEGTTSGPPASGAESRPSSPSVPSVTASVPPGTSSRGADGQLVRVFSAPAERTWTVAQSVLRSLGWDIERADQATGVIRTGPRNVTFKDFVLYAEGTRHTLGVVIRPVSESETSISVRRELFEEKRILWTKERQVLATPESPVEQTVLDAIERLL